MESDTQKPSILESFIKYTVLYYLFLIVTGYFSAYCYYYKFFGISPKTYFSIEDYINEIFSYWGILLLDVGSYFCLIVLFKSKEKLIPFPPSYESQDSISVYKRVNKLIIFLFSSIAIVFIGLPFTYLLVTGKKEYTFFIIFGIPIFLTIILYLLLDNFIKLKSLNMTKFNLDLGTIVVFLFLMNMAKYYDMGYTLTNLPFKDKERTFYLNTGAIINTSDSILYLGDSKDYIFLFDKSHKKSVIYSRSTIIHTEFEKK